MGNGYRVAAATEHAVIHPLRTKGSPWRVSDDLKGARNVFEKLSPLGHRTGDDSFSCRSELVRRILVA
jgi:hypothetical protein